MHVHSMNWMQVETDLERDDRVVLPLGSTEQHAQLSLGVDAILAERVALDAAEPLAIPVYPVLAYGVAPYFTGYPGTVSLSVETYARLVRELLDNLYRTGFRRILIVNGHGGNAPAGSVATEWGTECTDAQVRFHNWWSAPRTRAPSAVKWQAIDLPRPCPAPVTITVRSVNSIFMIPSAPAAHASRRPPPSRDSPSPRRIGDSDRRSSRRPGTPGPWRAA